MQTGDKIEFSKYKWRVLDIKNGLEVASAPFYG